MRKSVLVRLKKPKLRWKDLLAALKNDLLGDNIKAFGKPYQDESTFLQIFQAFEQTERHFRSLLRCSSRLSFARQIGDYVFFLIPKAARPNT